MNSISTDRHSEVASEWKIPPFWQKLNSFFLFPLQMEPLLYALLLSVCSYGLMFGVIGICAVGLGLMLAVSRYAFKVSALASRGLTNSADFRSSLMEEEWKWLPWKFFGVLFVFGLFVGFLASRSMTLGIIANLVVAFLIPATWMVLINTNRLSSAINPFELLATIFGIGKSYLLLCFFLFLLQQGSPMVMVALLKIAKPALVLPLMSFVMIYFTWVMAAMIGYVMYQHHAALDIDPVQAPEGVASIQIDPKEAEAKHRDAVVARLVQDNKMDEAVHQAREWQRGDYESLPDHRRYFRVLKLTEQADSLADLGQRFIPMLMAQQRTSEALEAWVSCVKRQPDFLLASAQASYDLAQQAWRAGKPKYVLMLAKGFENRFAGSALIPSMLELVVRAYKQGLDQPMQGVHVYMRMKQLFPDHASTKEVEWVLRGELEKLSSKPD
ncbi:hypothetical protein KUF54_11055 [Comamonas sp. Y33R10-2]|uniref:hypothetical protein n=1 Tax=Comamonas sp. Y33R10-2 TaxID=2853257 RepID=UPI001C5CB3FE|nr:hypothetical protein [Comamonas sp. Y33R10-2]QXZ08610.1 hypothetical protein KUF54_11055 [Comamonas sp. Y33R10-2]